MKSKVCLALATIIISSAQPACATDWLQRGINAYAARDYNEAVQSLSFAVKEDPDLDIAHYHLANALMKIGHQNHAIEEYKKAYEVRTSAEMYQNCMSVFRIFNVTPPPLRHVAHTRRVHLDPYTTNTLQAINAQAAGHQRQNWESDPRGVEVFKFSPENSDGMRQAWDQWIYNFRLLFGTRLNMIARGRVRERMSGAADMVFSVDSNHRLRGKIVQATTPDAFNESLLVTTKFIDGSPQLNFPGGANIPGYNFTMNWDFGAPRRHVEAVNATLQSTGATLRTGDLNAAAGRLRPGGDVNGRLSNKDVSAKLSSEQTLAKLGEGSLAAEAKALPMGFLPKFAMDVNGRVLLGKPASLDVDGRVLPNEKVGGKVLPKEEVGGKVLPDKPAALDVGGRVLPGTEVGGRVVPEKPMDKPPEKPSETPAEKPPETPWTPEKPKPAP